MQQRCEQIRIDSGGQVDISRTLLLMIYREHNIVRRQPSYKFNRNLRSPYQFMGEKIDFLNKLLKFTRENRQIIYMDETSTHLWEKMKSFWMPKNELIDVSLNKDRGHSITIIGGISNRWPTLQYILTDKTNINNVEQFFKHIENTIQPECVMVLDNHAAHRSGRIKNLAHRMGIELLFMPPTASELNPVEKMWSYFKRQWRKRLYDP